mmetsp:Transcript_113795/g.321815  ORF Transcript_113795/g.321815 Transcript_113795/m.321815 type:complete len:201 (+) Transcript_113795:383-985(+)
MQPRPHMSAFGPMSPFQTSGAMVAGVPFASPASFLLNHELLGSSTIARPRSDKTACGLVLKRPRMSGSGACRSKMLPLLMSMCTSPLAWQYDIASKSCLKISVAQFSRMVSPARLAMPTASSSSPPAQNSITMVIEFVSSCHLKMRAMWGWSKFCSTHASCTNRARFQCSGLSIVFTAIGSPVFLLCRSLTTPKVPFPRS